VNYEADSGHGRRWVVLFFSVGQGWLRRGVAMVHTAPQTNKQIQKRLNRVWYLIVWAGGENQHKTRCFGRHASWQTTQAYLVCECVK
jgi:hypothetical protein